MQNFIEELISREDQIKYKGQLDISTVTLMVYAL